MGCAYSVDENPTVLRARFRSKFFDSWRKTFQSFPANAILQLKIDRVSELEMGDLPYEQCTACGRKKYLPITRGFWPLPLITDQSSLFKSSQYFGSGANAFRLVIASANLYRSMADSNLKGILPAPSAISSHQPIQPGLLQPLLMLTLTPERSAP